MNKLGLRPNALLVLVLAVTGMANEETVKKTSRAAQRFDISVTPLGPTQADVDAAKLRAEQSSAVRAELKGSKYRFLSFEYVETGDGRKDKPSRMPTRFRTIFYNYSNDFAVIAEGDFQGRESITAVRGYFDPGVGGDEMQGAREIVRSDPQFADQAKFELYPPMPPISNFNGERLINIGVRDPSTGEHYIVGVSFKNNKVVRYADKAPPRARATPEACGITYAGQSTTGQSGAHPGQYQLTANSQGAPLWEMLVIRPNVSSGAVSPFPERSGIEIRDVKYKGKSVLKRGHAPILNVKYIDGSGCGPYRDWQYEEGFFAIPSTNVTYPNGTSGGIAILPEGQIATTSVETRNDVGNFRGVAIYQQTINGNNEMVLVTEMEAGWYRYIMEWRFGADGVIRPRYGFGSTTSSCVCVQRDHHVYWRLDFDIVSPVNRVFQVERGRKFMRPVETEAAIFRNYGTNRGFVIQNAAGNEAYSLFPGSNDGSVATADGTLTDAFGKGDFWLMRFQTRTPTQFDPETTGELDDIAIPGTPAANLAPWINGESLLGQDVVIWYAAHQRRVDDASRPGLPEIITGTHVVGPEIRPIQW